MPFVAWSLTGLFFLLRPAYEEAYEPLLIKSYPVAGTLQIPVADDWLEYRYLSTVLGPHLLVRTELGWQHLTLPEATSYPMPQKDKLVPLIEDAISENTSRYGSLDSSDFDIHSTSEQAQFFTDTGVEITLDWEKLSLHQRGRDTYWINQIYDIHYLRWTGVSWLDEIVGVTGLILLLIMTVTGFRMLFFKASR